MACGLQAEMFKEAGSAGKLAMRLIYYLGFNECRATGWITDPIQLAALMGKITCVGGHTQIGKVLADARREASASGVRALVFVGDAMEVEGRRPVRPGRRTRSAEGAMFHVSGRS